MSKRPLPERRLGLPEFLRAELRAIIDLWTAQARSLAPARELETSAIQDQLPEILERIADLIESQRIGHAGTIGEGPNLHALHRLAHGFDLDELVIEYAVLRRTILELWASRVNEPIDIADLLSLNDGIDRAISDSVNRYGHARDRTLRALDQLSEAALGTQDLDVFLGALISATKESMEDIHTVAVLLRESDILRVRASVGLDEDLVRKFSEKIGEGFAGRIAEEGRPLFVRDAGAAALLEGSPLRGQGVRALYGAPLAHHDGVVGVALMGSLTAHEFSQEDRVLFQTMIGRATLVIHNILLGTRERASAAAARAFAKASTFAEAIAGFLPALGTTLGWDVGLFWKVDETRGLLVLDQLWKAPNIEVPELERSSHSLALPLGRGLPGRVWQSGATVFVPEVQDDGDLPRRTAAIRDGLQTGIGFPIIVNDKTLGVIELFGKSGAWSGADGTYLTSLITDQLGEFTRRIAAQEALRRSSAKNAAILEAALDCVLSMDASGMITEWNKSAERTFGYSRKEAIGREMAELILPPHLRAAFRDGFARYLATGEQQVLNRRIELSAARRDGSEFPVEVTVIKLPHEDPPIFTGFLRDITEAKHTQEYQTRLASEQRFLSEAGKQLAESLEYEPTLERIVQLAVPALADWCVVDLLEDGKLIRSAVAHVDTTKQGWAKELEQNYPPELDAVGVGYVVRTGTVELISDFDDALLVERSQDAQHVKLMRNLGIRSYIGAPIIARGRVLGAISMISAREDRRYTRDDVPLVEDLAVRAAAAIENARLYREARTAVRVREDVLAIVSHDLRNPLNLIAMSAALLHKRALETGAKDRKHIEIIQRATGRMERLIGDLLDMASIQAGRLSVELGALDLAPLLHEALEGHEGLAAEANAQLVGELDVEEITIEGDRQRLLQALSNLLGNAIKFARPGDTITLRAGVQNDEIVVSVIDTGPGIPADQVAHVFAPYWTSKRSQKGGTGLGLYITKGIVEAHGGRIWIQSHEGQGTTLSFTLRRVRAQPQSAPA